MGKHLRAIGSNFPKLAALALLALCLGAALASVQANGAFAQEQAPNAELTAGSASSDAGKAEASPKLTAEQRLAKVNLSVRAKLQHDGWKPAVKSGKTAGSKTAQGFRMLKAKLTGLGGVSGSIRYKTYVPGSGWSKAAKDGKASGSNKRAITAVRIYLRGTVSKHYDVYYRTYFKGFGWLDWAKNNEVSGTKSTFGYVSAMQVKLVKKGAEFKGKTAVHQVKDRWGAIELKYRDKAEVKQILEVKYTGGTRATVALRTKKKNGAWKTALSCQGYVGSRGIGSAREGLARTPSGDFGITEAFGILDDPGAKLNYVKVNDAMYWCGDSEYYNQLIDINECPHDCEGEHLIDCRPYYDYGLFFDYNTNPVRLGKGSAFFVHCKGGESSTEGCIAVAKANMVKIIRKVSEGARLCIYSK